MHKEGVYLSEPFQLILNFDIQEGELAPWGEKSTESQSALIYICIVISLIPCAEQSKVSSTYPWS